MVSYALTSVGVIGLGLYLLRRWRSSKWGLCTSTRVLTGQVIVITGANSGLGAEAARDFAKRGATVILACRSFENTKDILKDIRVSTGNNDVHYMHLDLANLESVREFSAEVAAKYPVIYALVCNAGVWSPMDKHMKTSDGFEIHAGVNHLGHFLLTNLLLDKLEESAPSRVVVVSSSLQSSGKLDFTTYDHFKEGRQPEPNSKTFAPTGYCDSKMMNALFTKELTVRLQGKGVTSVCICPGWCYTQLARHVNIPFYKKVLFMPIAFMLMRSAARGAQNIIQAVVEEDQNLISGGFYRECKLATKENSKLEEMSEVGLQLWDISEKLTGL
jgi:light-dependent protochlorophyllide reductase